MHKVGGNDLGSTRLNLHDLLEMEPGWPLNYYPCMNNS